MSIVMSRKGGIVTSKDLLELAEAKAMEEIRNGKKLNNFDLKMILRKVIEEGKERQRETERREEK